MSLFQNVWALPDIKSAPIVRFAPSPTGFLHVGNARVALLNWFYAKANNGTMILRSDDTDTARNRDEYSVAIEQDLTWLGLSWDAFFAQSERLSRYDQVVAGLKHKGVLYPCFETTEELTAMRNLARAQKRPPIYDRRSLKLTPKEYQELIDQGRTPHWRLKLYNADVVWHDAILGEQRINLAHVSDPVLIREDGRYLYTLTSVVDDLDIRVNMVIRGADHVVNTAVQCALIVAILTTYNVNVDSVVDDPRALSFSRRASSSRQDIAFPCSFAHVPLLMAADGSEISKRLGTLSLRSFRDQGVEPEPIATYLTTLGKPNMPADALGITDLLPGFSLGDYRGVSPRFSVDQLLALNRRFVRRLATDDVQKRSSGNHSSNQPHHLSDDFVEAVSANLESTADVLQWWQMCHGVAADVARHYDTTPVSFYHKAISVLPSEPWTENTLAEWSGALSDTTGVRGKKLFMPLRLALTGRQDGPELKKILPFIGYERTRERLDHVINVMSQS